jgi:hypothetical protein
VPRMTRYVLLCRHAPHQGGMLTPDEKTKRYPTQDVADRLREELLFGRQVNLAKLLYAPTPEARQTAWLLRKELEAVAQQRSPAPATPAPADMLLDVARSAVRQLGEALANPSSHSTLASPDVIQPDAAEAEGIRELEGTGNFAICPPDWTANERISIGEAGGGIHGVLGIEPCATA